MYARIRTFALVFTTVIAVLATLAPATAASAAGGSPIRQSDVEPRVAVGEPVTPVVADLEMADLPVTTSPGVAPPLGELAPGESDPALAPGVDQGDGDALAGTYRDQGAMESAAVEDEAFTLASPNFPGIGVVGNPPDTNIDVGPDHVVQMVNTSFQMWDKAGTSLLGPIAINQLWVAANAGNLCRVNNNGDPVVVYDHLANRWVLTQFAIPAGFQGDPTGFCVAVSQTGDPTDGLWYLYEFVFSNTDADPNPQVNFDYPKIAVWPDAYYVSSQQGYPGGSIDTWAYDRANMLNGNPATYQRINAGTPALVLLPGDLDGAPPPAGTPAVFARHVDGDLWGAATGDATDRVELYEFHVDWSNPAASTLSAIIDLPTLGFDSALCSPGSLFDSCVPQPGVSALVETLPSWPMYRLQFRQFAGYQSLVFNHTVDADGLGHAGIRWYELRKSGGAWAIHQQGNYSPDAGLPGLADDPHRWMGSIAMDKRGNLALGYSAASGTLFPEIRYTGRRASDPLGLLPAPEVTMVPGSAAIGTTGGVRWGDYSSMVVDPVDDCTFWFSTEYGVTGLGRETRIGAFRFSDCNRSDLSVSIDDRADPVLAGQPLIYDVTVGNAGPDQAFDIRVEHTLPLGVDHVADTAGCAQGIAPNGAHQLTCDLGDLAAGDELTFTVQAAVPSGLEPGGLVSTVEVSSPWLDPVPSNNTDSEFTLVEAAADVAVTKVCKPDGPLPAGQTGFCDILIDNAGPSDAADVELVDEITADTELTSLTAVTDAAGASCTADLADLRVECMPVDVPAGERVTVHVEFSADEPGDVNDVASITSATPDPDASNNSAQESVTVSALADLAVTVADAPDPVVAGTALQYQVTVTNAGPSTATAAVTTAMPAEVAFASATVSDPAGSCAHQPTGTVACQLGDVPAGAAVTVTIDTIVDPATPDGATLSAISKATSAVADPALGNNTATAQTDVITSADVAVTLTSDKDKYRNLEVIHYEITVANAGPSDAQDVTVSQVLPDKKIAEYVANSAGCPPPSGPSSGPTFTCPLGTLAAGNTVIIQLDVKIKIGLLEWLIDLLLGKEKKITQTASVTSSTTDPAPANNSSTRVVTVRG